MIAYILTPSLFLGQIIIALALICGFAGAMLGYKPNSDKARVRVNAFVKRESEFAAALAWPVKRWLWIRGVSTVGGLFLGILSGVPLAIVIGFMVGAFGVKWALGGRAASRRLKMERAFVNKLRTLRQQLDFMAIDMALRELGRNPGQFLEHILAPLDSQLPINERIMEVARRSESALVENACTVMIAARARDQASFGVAIDRILLSTSEQQIAILDDAYAALSQQRAVAYAMTGLLIVFFVACIKVDTFAAYYRSFAGQVVLLIIVSIFAGLVLLLGRIVRVQTWSRWDLDKLAKVVEDLRLG